MSEQNQQQQQNTNNNNNNSSVSTFLPTKSNIKVLSEAENGDLYLKVFLLGGDVNGNKWGIDQSTVEQNIKSAIGKPLVIYKDTGLERDAWPRKKGLYNHPPWDEHSIEHSKEIQKVFSVGEIKNYAKNQQTGDYWGMVKITDPDLKQVLKRDPTLPFYVSPQLWRLNKNQPNEALKEWEFMHLAIVSMPAFGVRATVQGSCSGDSESCTSHFMNASLKLPKDEFGAPKRCDCVRNAMKEVAEQTVESERTGRTIHYIDIVDTSHLTNSSNLKTEERLSDNSNTNNENVSAGVPNATTVTENVVPNGTLPGRTVNVEHKTYDNPQVTTYRPNANPQQTEEKVESKPTISQDKAALIAQIERERKRAQQAFAQINTLARDNQALAGKASKYESEVSELRNYVQSQQAQAREDGIAEIIYNANLADLIPEEKKEQAIKLAISKNLQPQDMAAIISPLYEAFDNYIQTSRQQNSNHEQVPQFNTPVGNTVNASLNRRESRLRLGANNNGNNNQTSNVANASTQNRRSIANELSFERARKLAGMYTPQEVGV